MDNSVLDGYALLAVIALIWLFPLFIIKGSSKTTGIEKIAWIFAVLFISWFAWIFYMILAPITRNEEEELGYYQLKTNVDHKPTPIDTSSYTKTVSSKPSVKDWLKENPGKTVNDYYANTW